MYVVVDTTGGSYRVFGPFNSSGNALEFAVNRNEGELGFGIDVVKVEAPE